jgi:hypothetical protein
VDTSRWVFVAQSHSQEDIVHATVSDVIRPDLVRDLLLQVSDVFTSKDVAFRATRGWFLSAALVGTAENRHLFCTLLGDTWYGAPEFGWYGA